ncbi:MAG: YHYH domain-containing protein [Patescibacteria group bacterium]
MKKIIAFFIIIALGVPSGAAFAHPGRTDSKGGHHCRTNCEKWGYEYGSYHFHDKKNNASTSAKSAKIEVKKSAKNKAKRR